jgi:hypothetical protein
MHGWPLFVRELLAYINDQRTWICALTLIAGAWALGCPG